MRNPAKAERVTTEEISGLASTRKSLNTSMEEREACTSAELRDAEATAEEGGDDPFEGEAMKHKKRSGKR